MSCVASNGRSCRGGVLYASFKHGERNGAQDGQPLHFGLSRIRECIGAMPVRERKRNRRILD